MKIVVGKLFGRFFLSASVEFGYAVNDRSGLGQTKTRVYTAYNKTSVGRLAERKLQWINEGSVILFHMSGAYITLDERKKNAAGRVTPSDTHYEIIKYQEIHFCN